MRDIQLEFEDVSRIHNKKLRGKKFEEILEKLFKHENFTVIRNSKVAKPRQTDLLADNNQIFLLIEAKWQQQKLDVSNIDDMRSRLKRVRSDIVGVIFSMSDFRDTAVHEVEADRSREILLFSSLEIRAVVNGEINLLNLINRKRDDLLRYGKVWFFQPHTRTRVARKLRAAKGLFHINGKIFPSLGSISENSNILFFTHSIPDTSWGASLGGQAVALNLQFDLNSVKDLHQLLIQIDTKFGLSNAGSFSIHQLNASWLGFGAINFVKEVSQWRARYQQIKLERFHHSEDFSYFDALQDGWILLTGRQRVNNIRGSELHDTELIIQLPGIPVDITPFLQFCRDTNNAHARFYNVGYHQLFTMRLKKSIRLDIVGKIISKENSRHNYVNGVIAKNPFFKNSKIPKGLIKDNSPFHELTSLEFLICDLKDWHDLEDKIDQYDLLRLEGFQAETAIIIRPTCTWRNIIDPSKSRKIFNHRNPLRNKD